jgi:hypothetical protein
MLPRELEPRREMVELGALNPEARRCKQQGEDEASYKEVRAHDRD